MTESDQSNALPPRAPARSAPRDSLLLMTILSSPQGKALGQARIRNLSSTGLMAETAARVKEGDKVGLDLRGVGKIGGLIAWVKGDRVGITFDEAIDPQLARKPVGRGEKTLPDYLRKLPNTRG